MPEAPYRGSARASAGSIVRQRPKRASLVSGWEYLLKVNGMTLNDLGPKSYGPVSSNAEAMKNRQAMAAGWFTVVPASFVMDLGASMKVRT